MEDAGFYVSSKSGSQRNFRKDDEPGKGFIQIHEPHVTGAAIPAQYLLTWGLRLTRRLKLTYGSFVQARK